MPSHAADGSITLVICTGDGPLTLAIDPATGQPADTDDHSACDWNCATPTVTLTAPVTLPLADGWHAAQCAQARPFHLTAAGATGLPPSTGPPFAI